MSPHVTFQVRIVEPSPGLDVGLTCVTVALNVYNNSKLRGNSVGAWSMIF